jgi:type II secretory pathway pseudopilin PulG
MKCLRVSQTSAKGFTILEMMVGMAMTLTVSAIALAALSNAEKGFTKDKNKIEGGQKLSSVLDIVGRDIVQSGEEINDASFPVIQVTPNGARGARIILYRGLEEALSLCSAAPSTDALTSGVATSSLSLTSTNNGVQLENSSCIPETGTTYRSNVQAWINRRTANGTNLAGQSPFFLHDGLGNIRLVNLINETSAVSFQTIGGLNISPFTPNINFPNRSTLNLVEKREYLICGTELKVRVNNSTEGSCNSTGALADSATFPFKTVATNITRMDITLPTIATPNPAANLTFPTGGLRWRDLRGVTVKITATNPDVNSLQPTIDASGRFYPRNIQSTNVL